MFLNEDNVPLNLEQFSLYGISNTSQNGGISNINEKDDNLSEEKSSGYGDDGRENYANNAKDICNPLDISKVSMCFSSDEVGATVFYNESISNKNMQVDYEEKAELVCDIV